MDAKRPKRDTKIILWRLFYELFNYVPTYFQKEQMFFRKQYLSSHLQRLVSLGKFKYSKNF